MSTNNTGKTGSGISSKIRGAAEAAHGMGETIRGTILGAVDSIGGGDQSVNKDIAAQGKMEYSQGMAKMRGAGAGATAGYGAGGGYDTGHGTGTGQANDQGAQAGAGASRPAEAYEAKETADVAGTKQTQAGGYNQQPTGHQNQPASTTKNTGAETDVGPGHAEVGRNDEASAPGSQYDSAGGGVETSGQYDTNKTSVMQDTQPAGGEYQQSKNRAEYPQETNGRVEDRKQ